MDKTVTEQRWVIAGILNKLANLEDVEYVSVRPSMHEHRRTVDLRIGKHKIIVDIEVKTDDN